MRGRGAVRRVDRREGPGVGGSSGAAVEVEAAVADLVAGRRSHFAFASFAALGGNSIEKFWLEFRIQKPIGGWLQIPFTIEKLKNGQFRHVT